MKFLLSFFLVALAGCASINSSADEPKKKPVPTPGFEERAPRGPAYDYDYAWDQFYHWSTLIWACRGAQSGEFVDESFCAFKPKRDDVWPTKDIPGHWKP